MKIVRNNQKLNKEYRDISIGEVFIRISDDDVYMRTDNGALSLEDGYYYDIDDESRVRLLDVELHIL